MSAIWIFRQQATARDARRHRANAGGSLRPGHFSPNGSLSRGWNDRSTSTDSLL